MLLLCLSEDPDFVPDPFPGSDKALDLGCICPQEQPDAPRSIFDSDCPIHQLDPAPRLQ